MRSEVGTTVVRIGPIELGAVEGFSVGTSVVTAKMVDLTAVEVSIVVGSVVRDVVAASVSDEVVVGNSDSVGFSVELTTSSVVVANPPVNDVVMDCVEITEVGFVLPFDVV